MTSKNTLLSCMLLLVFKANSQQVPVVRAITPAVVKQPVAADTKLYITPDIPPEFRGGDAALKTFVDEHLDRTVPTRKKAPAGHYIVVVRCIIGNDGALIDVSPESRFGYGMEEELMRVLKKSPRWTAGKHNGKVVNAIKKVSVTFSVR